ncbi:Uncharacterised protein [Bordetella pertussis]|nr:Uncharacterised protein [Bordetella pertussis]CPI78054.1 Uncharacterised protein [Bordetella pertussis]CPO93605.1 Uncharacterised protein [Bordetella pertussis]
MTSTRSATKMASDTSWVMKKIVGLCSCHSCSSSSCIRMRVW